jgi:hypothetical protein
MRDTHFEFLVPPQDLRAQRDIVNRTFVILVHDVVSFAIPVLPLVGRFCPRLALSFRRRRRRRRRLRAWCLSQLYALHIKYKKRSCQVSDDLRQRNEKKKATGRGGGERK